MTFSAKPDYIDVSNYRPQRSWGKVIFSEACVKNSVQAGVVYARGVFAEGVCGGGVHVWRRVCMAEG